MDKLHDIIILLPTYNEAGNLPQLISNLKVQNLACSFLVVDDNSPDGTGNLAAELAKSDPTIEVLHRAGKLGLGTAHQYAMRYAIDKGYKILLTMDVDFTHRPEDVQPLLDALNKQQLDVVVGSRYVNSDSIDSWPIWRQFISRSAYLSTRYLLGIPVDATSAFRAYRIDALSRVPFQDVKGDGYSFMFEMLMLCMQCGLKIDHVGVEMPCRNQGKSKISQVEIFNGLRALGKLTVQRIIKALANLLSSPAKNKYDER
ncbi:MAG: dolichol-phosphate mannosyltransferase [Gammaproteobacteria bacterium]|jgi:dolichol-phosphate mannosyltransferase